MLETSFSEFPALLVDPRVGIRPMFDYFLIYDIKNYILAFVNSFIFDILRRTTTFFECHSVFLVVVQKYVTSEI